MRASTRCIICFPRTAAAPAPTSPPTGTTSIRSTSASASSCRGFRFRRRHALPGKAAPLSPASSNCRCRLSRRVGGQGPRAGGGLCGIPGNAEPRRHSSWGWRDLAGPWPLRGPAHGRARNAGPHRLPRLPAMGGRQASSRRPRGHGNLYHDLALGCAFDGGEIEGHPAAFADGRVHRRPAGSVLGRGPGVEPAALLAHCP